MTGQYRLGESADPAALLDRAIAFTLGAVHAVTPERLSAPTPCAQWDLRALLLHVADSLEALGDGLGTGRMDLAPASATGPSGSVAQSDAVSTAASIAAPGPGSGAGSGSGSGSTSAPASASVASPDPPPLFGAAVPRAIDDPVAVLRAQAARLLGVWAAGFGRDPVRIADSSLDPRIVLGVGAVEIAVHGWDICRACGLRRPIPPALAIELTAVCALVVTADTRYPAFAAPIAVPSRSCPSDRLVAFLGRDPDASPDADLDAAPGPDAGPGLVPSNDLRPSSGGST